ncbi:MAG: hypothetical protein EZS28_015423 [Streblomastix strix]|uniref:Uncharacterized protein n=1 Tax=Streblomastix strix TaxID=222440 RepID=A0A5J4W2X8_9EUKA|nr:MAG: hypothetical protein EZS28_015423 [Streblomastix strix]
MAFVIFTPQNLSDYYAILAQARKKFQEKNEVNIEGLPDSLMLSKGIFNKEPYIYYYYNNFNDLQQLIDQIDQVYELEKPKPFKTYIDFGSIWQKKQQVFKHKQILYEYHYSHTRPSAYNSYKNLDNTADRDKKTNDYFKQKAVYLLSDYQDFLHEDSFTLNVALFSFLIVVYRLPLGTKMDKICQHFNVEGITRNVNCEFKICWFIVASFALHPDIVETMNRINDAIKLFPQFHDINPSCRLNKAYKQLLEQHKVDEIHAMYVSGIDKVINGKLCPNNSQMILNIKNQNYKRDLARYLKYCQDPQTAKQSLENIINMDNLLAQLEPLSVASAATVNDLTVPLTKEQFYDKHNNKNISDEDYEQYVNDSVDFTDMWKYLKYYKISDVTYGVTSYFKCSSNNSKQKARDIILNDGRYIDKGHLFYVKIKALFNKHLGFESFAYTMMSKRQDAISQHNDTKQLYYRQILNSAFGGEGQNNAMFDKISFNNARQASLKQLKQDHKATRKISDATYSSENTVSMYLAIAESQVEGYKQQIQSKFIPNCKKYVRNVRSMKAQITLGGIEGSRHLMEAGINLLIIALCSNFLDNIFKRFSLYIFRFLRTYYANLQRNLLKLSAAPA